MRDEVFGLFDEMDQEARRKEYEDCGFPRQQDALVELMNGGHLWGAALDVTTPEPLPEDSPLWDVPNLLLTAHVAGGLRLPVTRENCVRLALENLRRYLAGEPLKNVVSRG